VTGIAFLLHLLVASETNNRSGNKTIKLEMLAAE
jgi:hypothetical protein